MTFIRSLVIVVWMLAALYVSVAGWVACKALEATSVSDSDRMYVLYDSLSFQNQQSLNDFLGQRQDAQLFPWIFEIPSQLCPFLTSIAFGVLGGVILLLKKIAVDRSPVISLSVLGNPAFSGLVGMMLFFGSFLAPLALVSGHNPARTESLAAVSLFGGAFSEVAYVWVEEQVKRLFHRKNGPVRPAKRG